MAGVDIKYKGSTIATIQGTGSKTLETSDKYCEADIIIDYTGEVADVVTYGQVNSVAAHYLSEVTYDPSDYSNSSVSSYTSDSSVTYKDKPAGYALSSTKDFWLLDAEQARCAKINANTIYNISPTANGGFAVIENSGDIQSVKRLLPTGSLRMIRLGILRNVRDLGGWACDGGTVKYGRLFRGSRIAGSQGVVADDADKNVMKNLLGIRTDIDFQLSSEGGVRDSSGLGEDVDYLAVPMSGYYDTMVSLTGSDKVNLKTALLRAMQGAVSGKPSYFHCFYGADRTGTFACVLEALLGISQSDIDKDYELTSFSGQLRERNGTVSGRKYSDMIAYFYTFGKSNLRDNVVKWALRLGIKLSEINAFRTAMIDGAPSALVADTFTVTNTLSNASTNNQAAATPEYDSYSATITADSGYTLNGATVSVTMGGTDITSSAYSNGHIYIETVTGNIAISVSAASSSRLPAAYQEVEYIENGTTAWIDTGVTSKYGIRTKVGASLTTTGGYQGVIAAYGNARDNVGYVGLKSWWAAPNAAAAGSEITLEAGRRYEIDCVRSSVGYLKYDSLSAGTNTYADFTNTVTYGLFARNRGSSCDYNFKGKVYYCEIYDGSTLIANLIPCYRRSDNVAGMYDLIREAFYTSVDTSKAFTKGPDV